MSVVERGILSELTGKQMKYADYESADLFRRCAPKLVDIWTSSPPIPSGQRCCPQASFSAFPIARGRSPRDRQSQP